MLFRARAVYTNLRASAPLDQAICRKGLQVRPSLDRMTNTKLPPLEVKDVAMSLAIAKLKRLSSAKHKIDRAKLTTSTLKA
ncbi:hypothetical protein PENSPDRAFT_313590 [Peniophora sp. CONT]|nr:hypothetical protein PENSPDRAFT_313590 [Peniophora sp. CONT]